MKGGLVRPKRPVWFVTSAAIATATLALGAVVNWWRGWSPASAWGMGFGIASTSI